MTIDVCCQTSYAEAVMPCKRETSSDIKGKYTRLMADCSEDLHARRLWNDVLRVLKDDNCQPRLLHLARFSFTAGEVKTFCGKDK